MIYRNEKKVFAVCTDNNIQLFEIQHIFYFDFHTIGDTLSRVTNDVIYKLDYGVVRYRITRYMDV